MVSLGFLAILKSSFVIITLCGWRNNNNNDNNDDDDDDDDKDDDDDDGDDDDDDDDNDNDDDDNNYKRPYNFPEGGEGEPSQMNSKQLTTYNPLLPPNNNNNNNNNKMEITFPRAYSCLPKCFCLGRCLSEPPLSGSARVTQSPTILNFLQILEKKLCCGILKWRLFSKNK